MNHGEEPSFYTVFSYCFAKQSRGALKKRNLNTDISERKRIISFHKRAKDQLQPRRCELMPKNLPLIDLSDERTIPLFWRLTGKDTHSVLLPFFLSVLLSFPRYECIVSQLWKSNYYQTLYHNVFRFLISLLYILSCMATFDLVILYRPCT